LSLYPKHFYLFVQVRLVHQAQLERPELLDQQVWLEPWDLLDLLDSLASKECKAAQVKGEVPDLLELWDSQDKVVLQAGLETLVPKVLLVRKDNWDSLAQ